MFEVLDPSPCQSKRTELSHETYKSAEKEIFRLRKTFLELQRLCPAYLLVLLDLVSSYIVHLHELLNNSVYSVFLNSIMRSKLILFYLKNNW